LAPAVANLWIFNVASGRGDRSRDIAADLFRIARDLGDDDVLLQANHCAWASEFFAGNFHTVISHAETGHALYDAERHAQHRHIYLGHDPGVCALNFAMAANTALGYFDRSARAHADGMKLARRINHAPSQANTLWRRCEANTVFRDVSGVREMAGELLVLTETHGLRQPRPMAQCYHGWALALGGDPAGGLIEIEAGLATLESFGARMNASCMRGLYAEALAAAGRHAEALTQLETGLALGNDVLEVSYDSWLHGIRGELLLHLRGAAEAMAALREGLVIAESQEARGFELIVALPLAHLEAEAGRRDAARDLLAPLCAWFTEGLDTPDLKEAKALLDDLA